MTKLRLVGLLVTVALEAASAASVLATPMGPRAIAFDAQILAIRSAMMATPDKALESSRAALQMALEMPDKGSRDRDAAMANWLQAEALTRLQRPEQALPILNDALKIVAQTAPNSRLQGDLLKSQGRADAALGRIQSALEDLQAAFNIYQRANEPRSEAMALQEIGSIYSNARDYQHVLDYNAQSREIFGQDPALNLTANNNRGFALKDLGRFAEAQAEFRKAMIAAVQLHSPSLQASILTNIAFTEALNGKADAARIDAFRGLALAARNGEASGEKPFLTGVLAKLEADRGNFPGSARLLDQVFDGVDPAQTGTEFRDFHELAAKVYEHTGDREKALAHLKAFKRLDDEGRALAASTNAALMSAQFDFANQNLRITKLKAGQLQRDIMLAQSKARLRTFVAAALFVAVGAMFLVTLLGFLSMRRSRDRIRAANDRLGVSNTALEKALRAKTEFLATTSHEIRTPLNGILGMTQVILADASVPAPLRERVQLVHGAGETMKVLVDDLLDMAKIETGSLTIHDAEFDLGRVLKETAQFWKAQAVLKGLDLHLDSRAAPYLVTGDEGRLRQVLYNLMSNAIKFTESGAVRLAASLEDGVLVIEVSDTGIGIADDQHGRIFEPFSQVDSGTSRKYAGAGLGLSICRKICAAMGATISVQSTSGEGSRFTVRAPLTVVSASRAASQGAVENPTKPAGLLVDANPLSASVLRIMLQPQVGTLATTASVEEAANHLASAGADLVLADGAVLKAMGGTILDGYAALSSAAPDAKVLVLLAAADRDDAASILAAGAGTVLVKPATASQVSDAVKFLLALGPSLEGLAA